MSTDEARRLPPFDEVEQRERQTLETAIADAAVRDRRFQPWWDLYRNRHHRNRVAILSYHQDGEGTYLWHFHLVRMIEKEEQTELFAAMRAVLHAALDPMGVTVKEEAPPTSIEPTAAVIFSVPIVPTEGERRARARRAWNEEYKRQDQRMAAALEATKGALAAGEALPACPFCGTPIDADVRQFSHDNGGTYQRAVLNCATPSCFQASIPMPESTIE